MQEQYVTEKREGADWWAESNNIPNYNIYINQHNVYKSDVLAYLTVLIKCLNNNVENFKDVSN